MESQTLINPRAIALGAYLPLVNDTRDFGAGSPGMLGLTDWEFSATTYMPTTGSIDGFVFHGLTLGKRFLDRHAAAMQFSNGSLLEVVFPSQGIIVGSEPTTVDTRIEYSEQFSLGYAFRISGQFSAGMSLRVREEKLTDTQYILEDTVIVRLPDVVDESDSWLADLAFRWNPDQDLVVAMLVRNLIAFTDGGFPETYSSYELIDDPFAVFGASSLVTSGLRGSAEIGTDGSAAIGAELTPNADLAFRGSLYAHGDESPFVFAFGLGVGWSYEFLQFDVSYLHFFDETGRDGVVDPDDFDPSLITNLDLNPYTGDRLSFSVTAVFAESYVSKARIDGVEIREAVFPSSAEAYSYRPLGNAFVTNTSREPLHLKATFFVDDLMDEPTQSEPVYLTPGQQHAIPLTAVFNDELNELQATTVREAVVTVTSGANRGYDDQYRQRIVVHGRNAWDGSVESLRFFVTPDDPTVIRYTRDVLLANRNRLSAEGNPAGLFEKARILFETFSGKLLYVGDPKQSADQVQYPAETLESASGDCDDMTVCFSSLLNSIGISTAFVDVVPPEDPANSHVYLLFDTGVHPANGSMISENPKRYVVRSGKNNRETIWIPVETTKVAEGFEEAWKAGAEEYFDDVEINLGLAKGWVRVLDVH